jgi:pilus assembly protein CpaF
VRPQFTERLQAFGVSVPDHIYDPQKRYEV